MKKRLILALSLLLVFIAVMAVMCINAEKSAEEIRAGVLRFHIVADSDSTEDQQNKFAVRDGIASLCSMLFKDSESKAESMEIAQQNKDAIIQKAEQILKERGSLDTVQVEVQKRFFPTRHYEGVSLPAGVYDTVDVKIGSASGQNFWCVMFPDICIGASVSDNKEKMADVLEGDALSLTTEKTANVRFKFRIIEIIESVRGFFVDKSL